MRARDTYGDRFRTDGGRVWAPLQDMLALYCKSPPKTASAASSAWRRKLRQTRVRKLDWILVWKFFSALEYCQGGVATRPTGWVIHGVVGASTAQGWGQTAGQIGRTLPGRAAKMQIGQTLLCRVSNTGHAAALHTALEQAGYVYAHVYAYVYVHTALEQAGYIYVCMRIRACVHDARAGGVDSRAHRPLTLSP